MEQRVFVVALSLINTAIEVNSFTFSFVGDDLVLSDATYAYGCVNFIKIVVYHTHINATSQPTCSIEDGATDI